MGRIETISLPNTRDLGGLTTRSGKTLKCHRALRSGRLWEATPEDEAVLVSTYGLQTVVDFRTQEEVREKPDQVFASVQYHWVPIVETFLDGITHENPDVRQTELEHTLNMLKNLKGTITEDNEIFYPQLLLSEFGKAHYQEFLELCEVQTKGSILWHCSEGKDRVGIGTALFLTLLDVDRQTIMEDFLLSNRYVQAKAERMEQEARALGVEEALIHEMNLCNTVQATSLEAVYRAVEAHWGSMEGFLEQEYGFTPARRHRLQENYCE